MRIRTVLALLGGLAGLSPAAAQEVLLRSVQSEAAAFRVVKVAGGLEHPWAMVFLPDGRALVSERPGRLALVEGSRVRRLQGLPAVSATGQGGLLDLALHPDFSTNGWIYFSYAGGGRRAGHAGGPCAAAG